MKCSSLPFRHSAALIAVLALCSALHPYSASAITKKDIPRQPNVVRSPEQTTEVLITISGKRTRGKRAQTAAQYAASKKFVVGKVLKSDPQMAVVRFRSVAEATKAILKMRKDSKVVSATFNRVLPHVPHAFVPNDPYFPQQWYLKSGYATLPGVSVAGAWSRNITGRGVVLGIVDEGVEKNHEDLAPNYDAEDSYDFAGNDTDPSPEGSEPDVESHGTSVAGVAAGAGGNGIGITGAAPNARLAGLKITFDGLSTVADFVSAVKYHSSGRNRNIKIKNHSYGFSFPYIEDTEEETAFNISAASGTIHTVSAGNDRFPYGSNIAGTGSGDIAEDSNKSVLSNNPSVITVAALGSSGQYAVYSSLGSNLFVTASSSSFREGELSILTTDRTGSEGYNRNADESAEVDDEGYAYQNDPFPDTNYTSTFGGTSSSAPLVAGVLALVKQANPALDVRTAKQLLARTSIRVDPSNPTWVRNAAGYYFSTDYGFGLVNASALVKSAKSVRLTPQQVRTSVVVPVGRTVPDLGSLAQPIAFNRTGKIEEVRIHLNVFTQYEGDLEATITSPQGTVSKFCHASAYDSTSGTLDWWFTTNAFWGEQGAGNWVVTVSDAAAGDTIRWNSVQLEVRSDTVQGTSAPRNDDFDKATQLTGKNFSGAANLDLATPESAEGDQYSIPPTHTVWFKWTAPVAGRLSLNTTGSDTDTIMTLYEGNSLTGLTKVVTNDNQGGFSKTSNIFTNVYKSRSYVIKIDAATKAPKNARLTGNLKACGE